MRALGRPRVRVCAALLPVHAHTSLSQHPRTERARRALRREGEEMRCLGAGTRVKKILVVGVQVGGCRAAS